MKPRDDELRIRLGRIRDRGRGAARPKTFVGTCGPQGRPGIRAAVSVGKKEVAVPVSAEAGLRLWHCRSARPHVGL
jgi:hypothetical protein